MEAKLRTIEVQEFVRRFEDLVENKKAKFCFFLGAGCSVSSGIDTAGTLVDKVWLPKLKEMETGNQENFNEWLGERFPEYKKDNAAQSYGKIIESLFPTPKERQTEIERIVKGHDPGFGYAVLTNLMEKIGVQCNIILTTNFDDMIADAFYLYTDQKPIVILHEALAAFVKISDTRPIVIKLHGDSKLSPLNTKDETKLSNKIKKVIKNLFSETGLIFIGYGGNDSSINEILNKIPVNDGSFPWGIYWIGERTPDNQMGEFLEKRNALWVKHKNFEELMLHIKETFELGLPTIDKFDMLFTKLLNDCTDLTETIYAKPDSDEKKILEKAASKASKELMLSIDPKILRNMVIPSIDLKIFKVLENISEASKESMLSINTKLIQSMVIPSIDPKILRNMVMPSIDPKILQGMVMPSIDPKILQGMIPSIDPKILKYMNESKE
ncbi:MAG: SIR2 family NAD-dependent protein deacylase [Methanosarcina sp.]